MVQHVQRRRSRFEWYGPRYFDPVVTKQVYSLGCQHDDQQHHHHALAAFAGALKALKKADDNPVAEHIEKSKEREYRDSYQGPVRPDGQDASPDRKQP